MGPLRFDRAALFLAALLLCHPAHALMIDFDALPAGKIVTSADLPTGFTISATNKFDASKSAPIVFDSACPGGCSGNDPDLATPGVGVGNDQAQNKVCIVAQSLEDSAPADGLVDDPNDEAGGGSITIGLPVPMRLIQLRVVDIDSNEVGSRIDLIVSGGGTLPSCAPKRA